MFTADMARAMPGEARFQKELADAEDSIRRWAGDPRPREVDHVRKIGVLISATDTPRMEAAMAERGFRTTRIASPAGFLRVYW
jgi:hypothetical protein